MNKRKSEEQWIQLVKKFNSSGLNVTAWCRESGFNKETLKDILSVVTNLC